MLLQKTIGGTMTSTSAEAAPGRAGMVGRASGRLHPLFALLLLALAIRVAAAVWPNVIYPDEVFQYLEPAWRMLGHDGVLTWEWREGIRGWFLPTLLAGPVALGDAIAPGGAGAFLLPRLIAASASLAFEDSRSGIQSATAAGIATIGMRTGLSHADLLAAGAVASARAFDDPELIRLVASAMTW